MSGTEQWTSQRYTQCWRWLLCGDKDHEKDEKADLYKQLGKMCAFFFVDDELKLLPTDIIAGLALIRERQLDRKRLLRESKEDTKEEDTKEDDTKDLGETLKNAHEIFPFALSAYGWLVRQTSSHLTMLIIHEHKNRYESTEKPARAQTVVVESCVRLQMLTRMWQQ
jgi:hypothetical protein